MKIIFTQHALSQIKFRNIKYEYVIECVKNPENETIDEFGNFIAQKFFSPYLIRVVYRFDNDEKIIITAYKTSKFKKYL